MARQLGEPYVFTKEEQDACRQKLWSRGLFQKTWDHFVSVVLLPPFAEQFLGR